MLEVCSYCLTAKKVFGFIVFFPIAPTAASNEARQIAELERLLEEYRGIVSAADVAPAANKEVVDKLTDEKEQLTREVVSLNNAIKTLKLQLEVAESKVLL